MPATQTFRTDVERYELINPIHEGPTATVWRARDTVADLDVVVKQLNGSNAGDPVARARLREEAAVSERISHPGAVPVIDTVIDKDGAALVFPYVPGKTLAERVSDQPPLTHREAAGIALELADILAAAHSAGVVHRDVKPANILLGDDGRVRLLDFGIASSELPLELTGSGMAIGTLPYMAPEQLTGSSSAPSADVFALGVVLYEMLSGARPFNGLSPSEQLRLHHEAPAPLAAPAALTALVAAMLSQLPAERPSAEQVGRSLRGWLDGRFEAEAVTAHVPVPVRVAAMQAAPSRGAASRPLLTPWVAGTAAAFLITLLAAASLFGFGVLPPATDSVNPITAPVIVDQSTPAPAITTESPVAPAEVRDSGANEQSGSRSTSDNSAQDEARHGDESEGKKKGHNKGNSDDDDRAGGDD